MQEFVINIMNQYGGIGIALLIAIENIFPPIPSELILTFGGFMTTFTYLTVLDVIIASTIGSLIGAIILYGVGRLLNRDRLISICDGKIGKILHLKTENILKSEEWFSEKSKYTVLFCRCIPIIRSLISIPAGMSKMNFGEFMCLTTVGTIIWNTIIVLVGKFAGNSWESFSSLLSEYSHIITWGIYIIIGFLIVKKVFKEIKNKIVVL